MALRTYLKLYYYLCMVFESYYFCIFFCAIAASFVYKSIVHSYSTRSIFLTEISILISTAGLEFVRICIGMKGLRSKNKSLSILSQLFSIPIIISLFYFILWQSYVINTDVIVSSILIVLLFIGMLLAVMS